MVLKFFTIVDINYNQLSCEKIFNITNHLLFRNYPNNDVSNIKYLPIFLSSGFWPRSSDMKTIAYDEEDEEDEDNEDNEDNEYNEDNEEENTTSSNVETHKYNIHKFTPLDNYTIFDFRKEFCREFDLETLNTTAKNIYNRMISQASRCLRIVLSNDVTYIFKCSYTGKYFNRGFFRNAKCIFKWTETDNNGKQKQEYCKINIPEVLESIEELFVRSCNIIPYHLHIEQNPDPTILNIFPGFKARFVPDADFSDNGYHMTLIKPLLNHIMEVFANNNMDHYRYILSWFAYPIRHLTKTQKCLVLVGEQGTGKSMVSEFLVKFLYGKPIASCVDGFDKILGDFNPVLSNKMYIAIDEASIDGNSSTYRAYFERFKSYLVSDTISINDKNEKLIILDNHLSYLVNSNNFRPVLVEEGDRRYAIFEVSNIRKNNVEYFNNLSKTLTQDAGDALYTYFLSNLFDYIEDIPFINPPCSNIKKEVIDLSKKSYEIYIDNLFDGNNIYLNPNALHTHNGIHYIIPSEIYKDYCMTMHGVEKVATRKMFITHLKRVLNCIGDNSAPRIPHTREYTIPIPTKYNQIIEFDDIPNFPPTLAPLRR
jgi:hypothetical protein